MFGMNGWCKEIPGGDTINRQAVIDACLKLSEARRKWDTAEGRAEMRGIDAVMCAIHDLPSAQPERMRGEWVEDDDGWDGEIWRCSECDAVFTLNDGTPEENGYNFCPNCGADMRGEDDE